MKIALAQIAPHKGDIRKNIKLHLEFISLAHDSKADLIVFSELSITGYEPDLAEKLALEISDSRLDIFQEYSDEKNITIAFGLPLKSSEGVHISMAIFSPNKNRKIHSKKYLHIDELPYFTSGSHYKNLNLKNNKIAFAICYEISVEEHLAHALSTQPDIYIASVAKHEKGMEAAYNRLADIAQKNNLPTLIVNNIGRSDNFLASGNSAVWNRQGDLLNELSKDREGLLIYDTENDSAEIKS